MKYFADKVIWITGASSGLGAELAIQLAKEKARLVLSARNKTALATVQEQCLIHTSDCIILPADLVNDPLDSLAAEALRAYGHIDILINNAGVTQRSLAVETDPEVDRRLMEINFFAPVLLTKQLFPHFQERRSGHVVAVSSMAGLMGFPMRTAYSAAKHALHGYFETLQVEHTIPGFHITIVSPGRVNTPISLHALTGTGSLHNQMDRGQQNGIPVQVCAAKILSAIEGRKKHVIIARNEKLLWWIRKFIPSLYYSIARKAGLDH